MSIQTAIYAEVNGRQLIITGTPIIYCGNSGYTISFTFDDEWSGYTSKTLRCVYRRRGKLVHEDYLFTGNTVTLRAFYELDVLYIGLYAGNLISTTVAAIPCVYSAGSDHPDPPPDIYEQLLAYLAGLQGGGAAAGITVPQLYGAAADAAGATTIIEEGTA